MAERAADQDQNDPVTLHRIMQTMIGEGLKARYRPPQKLSHEIFVLMLQLKEEERRRNGADRTRKSTGRTREDTEPTVAASRVMSASR
jgi:hypothetical protein